MASGASPRRAELASLSEDLQRAESVLWKGLKALASLRLTVVLFALSLWLVFCGTLAQDKQGIWEVVSLYFRSWIVYIPTNVFFPKAWFSWAPSLQNAPYGHLFVGGKTLGVLLSANLIAAHALRFKSQAKGQRYWLGWGLIAAGVGVCAIIISYGNLKAGVQDQPWFEWGLLWNTIVAGCLLLAIACGFVAFRSLLRWFRSDESQGGKTGLLLGGSLSLVASLGLFVLIVFLWFTEKRLDDAALRVLWQLIQGTVGGLILLVGCLMVFKKRGGIVLLHLGVGLLMFNELFVSVTNVEQQISLIEGEETNVAKDIRYLEYAIVDRSDADVDKVVTIAADTVAAGDRVELDGLPFVLRVDQFLANSELIPTGPMMPKPEDLPEVTQGIGLTTIARSKAEVAGASSGNEANVAAAYVTLLDSKTDESLAILLLPQEDFFRAAIHPVEVGGKSYYLSLRFKQLVKPYAVQLLDVERENYVGTSVPKTYESDFIVHRLDDDTSLEGHISMNEPLRYGGETFYQSGYFEYPDGREQTTLQVVTNAGWMMPYVACMLVAIGMLAHFSVTLLGMLSKTVDTGLALSEPVSGGKVGGVPVAVVAKHHSMLSLVAGWTPAMITLVLGLSVAGALLVGRSDKSTSFDLARFETLPVTSGGRIMPMDSLARNSLRKLQKKESVKLGSGESVSPTHWLLDVITQSERAGKYKVFKVHNLELLSDLGLKRRSGFLYSYDELEAKREEIARLAEVSAAKQQGGELLEKVDEAASDLMAKMQTYEALVQINRLYSEDESQGRSELIGLILVAERTTQPGQQLPLIVPTPESGRSWETLTFHEARRAVMAKAAAMGEEGEPSVEELAGVIAGEFVSMQTLEMYTNEETRRLAAQGLSNEEISAELRRQIVERDLDIQLIEQIRGQLSATMQQAQQMILAGLQALFPEGKVTQESNPAGEYLSTILTAYQGNDVSKFNTAVEEYHDEVSGLVSEGTRLGTIGVEHWYQSRAPFYIATILYLFAFVVGLLAWVGSLLVSMSDLRVKAIGFHRATMALLIIALCLHTIGLLARIYISGRPPVTNLYSSAIFIGWFGVGLFLVIERVTRVGIGNMLAAVAGVGSLLLAYNLGVGQDTFSVMQAVLDTQFWLATHVVCITLGYGMTYVAGFLGVVYLLGGLLVPVFSKSLRKVFSNLTYGTICFALWFSFVGTVLGGLWADDSWGRFWGWDPKENGALIIVIWNALILHARWGAMIRERGLAVLAVFGNVVTAWSWFGTNQLGFGLHSYGFTEGVLLSLAVWVGINLFVMALGLIPTRWWLSHIFESRKLAG